MILKCKCEWPCLHVYSIILGYTGAFNVPGTMLCVEHKGIQRELDLRVQWHGGRETADHSYSEVGVGWQHRIYGQRLEVSHTAAWGASGYAGGMEALGRKWCAGGKSSRGAWGLFQAKGEANAKAKWHDLGVSWGSTDQEQTSWEGWEVRQHLQGALHSKLPDTRLLRRTTSAASIVSSPPNFTAHRLPDTPNCSPVSPSFPVK